MVRRTWGQYSSLSPSLAHLAHTTNITLSKIKCERLYFYKVCSFVHWSRHYCWLCFRIYLYMYAAIQQYYRQYMYMYIYVNINIFMINTYIYIYIYMHSYVSDLYDVYIYIYVCVCVCVCVFITGNICTCIYMCAFICIRFIYIYIYIYILSSTDRLFRSIRTLQTTRPPSGPRWLREF